MQVDEGQKPPPVEWKAVEYLCIECAHRWNGITPKAKVKKIAVCPECKTKNGEPIRIIEDLD